MNRQSDIMEMIYNKKYFESLEKNVDKMDMSQEEINNYVQSHNYASVSHQIYKMGDIGSIMDANKAYIHDILLIEKHWKDSVKMLEDFGVQINDVQQMGEQIDKLSIRVEKVRLKWLKSLENKEKTCEHEWTETGHDSHYTYRMCLKCGKEERY